jgi:hypothetical protein
MEKNIGNHTPFGMAKPLGRISNFQLLNFPSCGEVNITVVIGFSQSIFKIHFRMRILLNKLKWGSETYETVKSNVDVLVEINKRTGPFKIV